MVLVLPVSVALLFAQAPAVAYLDGRELSLGVMTTAVVAAALAVAIATLSPFWNGVLAGAMTVVASRWLLAFLLTGKAEAFFWGLIVAACGYGCWRLGPPSNDWNIAPEGATSKDYDRARTRIRQAGRLAAFVVLMPLAILLIQGVLLRAGMLERLYPANLWIFPLLVSLVAAPLALIVPRAIRGVLFSVAMLNAAVWAVTLLVLIDL